MKEPTEKYYNVKVESTFVTDQVREVLNKAHTAFGPRNFIARDLSGWMKEELNVDMHSKVCSKHLLRMGFKPIRNVNNMNIYQLKYIPPAIDITKE